MKNLSQKEKARLQFADWLKENHPAIFQRAVAFAAKKSVSPNSVDTNMGAADVSGNATQKGSFWSNFGKAAVGLGTTLLALKNQREVMKINLARAQNGQPPIDPATSAPVVRTQVDLSPQLTNRLLSTAGDGISKTLLIGAAGIAAFFVAKKFL